MRIVHWIFAACLLTASCDVIFSFNIGGKVRLASFLMVLICLAALAKIIQDGRILWPRGGTALALWLFLQLLFVPLSGVLAVSFQFFALLLFSALGIFAVVQIYGLSSWTESIMRIYMASFAIVGIFGLIQFTLPAFGGPSIFVQQWLIHGRIPRINGFNSEPSYFATYLLMGWITLVDLRLSRARIASGRFWKWATIAAGAALVISTSKTAWAVMIVEIIARATPAALSAFRSVFRQLPRGTMFVKLPTSRLVVKVVLGVVFGVGALTFVFSHIDPWRFLSGTGLGGTAAHSFNDRNFLFQGTIRVIKEHPWIGRGEGGVPVAIAADQGIQITDISGAHLYWGFPVPLDVLAASGIFGFIPFLVFAWSGTFGAQRFARRYWPEERAKWLHALGRGMIFEWLLLLTDQNLMRVYVWFHMAMVALVAYHLEFGPVPLLAEADHSPASPVIPELGPDLTPAFTQSPATL